MTARPCSILESSLLLFSVFSLLLSSSLRASSPLFSLGSSIVFPSSSFLALHLPPWRLPRQTRPSRPSVGRGATRGSMNSPPLHFSSAKRGTPPKTSALIASTRIQTSAAAARRPSPPPPSPQSPHAPSSACPPSRGSSEPPPFLRPPTREGAAPPAGGGSYEPTTSRADKRGRVAEGGLDCGRT